MSVTNACRGLIAKIEEETDKAAQIHTFALPHLVIDGSLFDVCLDAQGQVQVESIRDGLLAWRNPVLAKHSFVRILTKEALTDLAAQLKVSVF